MQLSLFHCDSFYTFTLHEIKQGFFGTPGRLGLGSVSEITLPVAAELVISNHKTEAQKPK
jgi:hypothetical protein